MSCDSELWSSSVAVTQIFDVFLSYALLLFAPQATLAESCDMVTVVVFGGLWPHCQPLRYSGRNNSFGTTGGTEVIQERVLLVRCCRRVQNHFSILCRFPRLRLELCISAHQLFLAFSYAFHSILFLGRSRNWMMPAQPCGNTERVDQVLKIE